MRDMFAYKKGEWYPHMSKAEQQIWERFIDKYPDAYKQCQYDFHVGEAPPFNTIWDDGVDRNQDKLYRFRIDVLGYTDERIDVIEIKKDARLTAMGEAEKYAELFIRDEEPQLPVGKVIITDRELPNMAYLCKTAGIKLFVV